VRVVWWVMGGKEEEEGLCRYGRGIVQVPSGRLLAGRPLVTQLRPGWRGVSWAGGVAGHAGGRGQNMGWMDEVGVARGIGFGELSCSFGYVF
jgi:hypothetical protein